MKVSKAFLFSLFSFCIAAAATTNVETVVVFGPEIFKADQSRPQPKSQTKTFTVQGSLSNSKIDIVNGAGMTGLIEPCDLRGGLGQFIHCLAGNLKAALAHRKRPTYIEVFLNGSKVVSDRPGLLDLSYTKAVRLKPNNTLVVLVKGSKNAFVTIRVRGERTNNPPIPSIVITQASKVSPSRVMLDASQSTDPDGQSLTYSWKLGDGATASGAIANHEYLQPGTYNATLTVTDSLGLSRIKNVQIHVESPTVPADPSPAALAIEPAVNSSVAEQMKFIYEGPAAVQFGVQPGTIDDSRAGHLRGKVVDEQGHPLAGVRVDLLGEGEIGYTFTRADGVFDLIANGGGNPVLTFSRGGYFKAQRSLELTGNISLTVPTVVLVRPDEKVTTVTMNSSAVQVAQGSTVNDDRGSRTTTVLIPGGTDAQIVLPNGGTRSMSALNIRATEYTVGSEGPNRMPAILPAQSAYTYAVELSADEALAAGASSVKFSKPLSFYVDNFLNMPTGTVVPLGVYNSKTASWEAEQDGYVFKILSEQNGRAVVDLYGEGNSLTSDELDQLGFDSAELTELAQLYEPGKTFWRFRIQHFSTLDGNFGAANRNIAKNGMGPETPPPPKDKCQVAIGCEIDYTRRTFSEQIPLPAMPFQLSYSTDRQAGYLGGSTYEIPLSNDVVPT